MTTPNELSNHATAQRKPAPTWTDLERGLAATLLALGEAHLVIATKVFAVETLRVIGVEGPEALEYSAWDAAQRPMSLPALRLARGKPPNAAPSARRAPTSKKKSKAEPMSAAARKVRSKLLAAGRAKRASTRTSRSRRTSRNWRSSCYRARCTRRRHPGDPRASRDAPGFEPRGNDAL
jgi:hypothetical protein